jgi:hypothetical protein
MGPLGPLSPKCRSPQITTSRNTTMRRQVEFRFLASLPSWLLVSQSGALPASRCHTQLAIPQHRQIRLPLIQSVSRHSRLIGCLTSYLYTISCRAHSTSHTASHRATKDPPHPTNAFKYAVVQRDPSEAFGVTGSSSPPPSIAHECLSLATLSSTGCRRVSTVRGGRHLYLGQFFKTWRQQQCFSEAR